MVIQPIGGGVQLPDGIGAVDMGDLLWTYDSENRRFTTEITDKYIAWNNVIADGYTSPIASTSSMSNDKQLKASRTDRTVFCTFFDAGSSVSDFVSAVSGTLIFYTKD